ncbi:predicted protein [Naegleria gruberi]|uniref:Predicted protein n=1 Tax=Naegleria gruberi TaxID=5762 RepID=D2VZH2_NAEGR|nr:uncharacterized protein NAEGRDRAFT_74487 [Naegleria gruberi]EFC37790.1 predicted protein [Naegleria gruberi]|eukprot:XP_002670534.1 predicted protein [Naegleria gruberi strain NEG-M]
MLLILETVPCTNDHHHDDDNSSSSQQSSSMSYVQRVNIHALHKHGYKLYDHRNRPQKPQLFSTCGWIPTSYLTTILPDPLVCSPNKSLDLGRALVDREEDIEQAEQYQKEHGMRMDNYESFCRDMYRFECWNDVEKVRGGELDRLEKVSTQQCHVHCLEAPKYDEFNIGVESFEKEKEEWKKLAREKFKDCRDVFFVKNSKHPGYLHWLIRSAYISETIINALNAFGDRPCLGYRRRISATEFETFHRWFTFEQLHERVMRFGLGLYQFEKEFLNQPRPFSQEEGRGFVGICSSNRADWFVADWASLTQSFISVALPQTKVDCISEDIVNMESVDVLKSISHEIICIINNSQIPLLVCSRDLTVKFLKLIKHGLIPSVKVIVQMEDFLVKKEEFDETSYKNAGEEELTKYLKNLRAVHQGKVKQHAKKLTSQDDSTSSPLYYLMKSRYKNSNLNMNVSIEELCDFNKSDDEFVIHNYISENDINLDCKSIMLARELSIELTDMTSIELSTCKDYPTFNNALRFNIRTNNSVNDLTTIVYTSGSTSTEPKGAVMTDRQYNENVQMEIYHYHPLVFITYAPLSHITDRMNTTACMVNGGRSGFNCGEMDKVFDDYQSIQPVTESNTPRFYNILYAEYQRLKVLEGDSLTPEKEEEIMQKVRNMLGGRIKSLVTGGASTSPQVVEFLKECFKCNVYNGYSSTECGYIGPIGVDGVDYLSEKIQEENKQLPRHIMKLKDVEIKLESVPELGYFITDVPFPRGEICVKSSTIISGYYRDTEKTKLSFDSENYFQTADIGEIDKEKLRLRIIDRKKNIFKLSQGEFVAPENLENLFISKTLFVDQIYIYGNSEKSFLVAVIVPRNLPLLKEKAKSMAIERNQIFEDSDLSRNGFIYKVIQDDLNKCAREAKLESYEIPKGFIIEMEIFTPENGKMTASYKLCRPALVKSYKEDLEKLYKEIEGEDMSTLDQVSNKVQLEEFLKKLFESGGVVDSLSSVRLSNLLSQKFNVKLGADKILQECKNNENPALAIMEMIEKLLENGQAQDELFRNDEELLREVKDLIKDIPIVDETLSKTIELNKNRNILITGSTGFIGVGLVCEQLFSNPESNLTCIIRGKSLDNERERLISNVMNYCYHFSPEEKKSLLETFNSRVSVILGDISMNRFGLDQDIYNKLETDIDTVIHCAANVNFIMNYTQLEARQCSKCY